MAPIKRSLVLIEEIRATETTTAAFTLTSIIPTTVIEEPPQLQDQLPIGHQYSKSIQGDQKLTILARQLKIDADQDQGDGGGETLRDTDRYSSTVTVRPSSTSRPASTSKSDSSDATSILAEAVAPTNLSWWQLFALIFGCVLAVSVGGWAYWRHRKKKRLDLEKKKREVLEEELKKAEVKKEKEMRALIDASGAGNGRSSRRRDRHRDKDKKRSGRADESDTESYWDGSSESESDDSISDGGTIRPSRRRQRRRPRDRDRRRDRQDDPRRYGYGHSRRRRGDSDVESDYSDETYYPRDRDIRRDREGRYRSDARDIPRDRYKHRRRYPSSDPYYDPYTPSTAAHPTPISSQTDTKADGGKRRKRDTFRDSVFSSIDSMKRAAVRLKYVEAKVKLKKQLEDEDKLEMQRKDKVRQANREIEEYNEQERNKRDKEKNPALLILPAPRPPRPPPQAYRKTSSPSSSGSNYSGQTPPRPVGISSSNLPNAKRRHGGRTPKRSNNHRQLSPQKSAMKTPTRPNLSRTGTDRSLNGEISHLLGGGGSKPPARHETISPPLPEPAILKGSQFQSNSQMQTQIHKQPEKKGWFANTFQSDWLAPPASTAGSKGVGLDDSPRTSVYLAVTYPKERPIIPRGGLAPAPPPKARISGASTVDRPGVNGYQYQQQPAGRSFSANSGIGRTMAGVGAGGASKWANRLREKRT